MDKDNKFYWIPVIELAVLAFTTLGTTITLFLHSDAKMDEFRKESLAESKDFHAQLQEFRRESLQETKDFHGRLCAIEERNREKL